MGAAFVYLDFEENQQDGAETGGYAAPSSPEFRETQLEKFRELAPEMDIVITTALIPGRDATKLWLEDMVLAMKPGSVIIDLAAERGGNCDLTVTDEKVVSKNGVTVVGYTDFPSVDMPKPRSSATCLRVSPLVSAIRTASLRNSSVLPCPISHLHWCIKCYQRSGIKPRQVHLRDSIERGSVRRSLP